MEDGKWQQAKKLFDLALNLPAEERSAFVDKSCGDDDELRSQLRDLVSSYDSEFLEESSLERAGLVLAESVF